MIFNRKDFYFENKKDLIQMNQVFFFIKIN